MTLRVAFSPNALERPNEPLAEVVVGIVWADERPLGGLPGLIDWHLRGALQRWVKRGEITGKRGETVLLPGRPDIAVEKIVLLGVGPKEGYGEAEFGHDLTRMLEIVTGLGAAAPLVELPLRRAPTITAATGGSILFRTVLAAAPKGMTWTIALSNTASREMMEQIAKEELAERKV